MFQALDGGSGGLSHFARDWPKPVSWQVFSVQPSMALAPWNSMSSAMWVCV